MATWDAEVCWTPSALRAAMGAASSEDLSLVGEGFDYAVFSEGETFVRVPRRQIAVEGLQTEARALALLGVALPCELPVVVEIGTLIGAPSWPWTRYRPVLGQELGALAAHDAPSNLAEWLGASLSALHAPELAARMDFLPLDPYRKGDMSRRAAWLLERLDALCGEEVAEGLPLEALRDVAREGSDATSAEVPRVAHGDLHLRHVIVRDGQARGIIDWGDVCLGDPAIDLRVLFSMLEPEERPRFVDAYGREPSKRELRAARLLAVFVDLVLLISARDFGLAHVERAAREGLSRAVR